MPDVVELRVHGVGGTPAVNLLGVTGPPEIVRVAGGRSDAFYARVAQPNVEGYAWGALTSGRPSQILWLLLLPFTLVNLGGWMLPAPDQARKAWIWKSCRVLIALLGLGMTATYVLGSFSVVVRRVFVAHEVGPGSDSMRLAAGSGVLLLALLVFYLVSRNRQNAFEGHAVEDRDDEGLIVEIPGSFTSSSELNWIESLVDEQDKLESETFWSHAKSANQLLNLHAAFAALLIIGLYRSSAQAIRPPGGTIDLQPFFIWLGLVEVLILLILVVLSAGFRNWWTNFVAGRFRVLGIVVAPMIGFVMSSGLFTIFALGVERCFSEVTTDFGGPKGEFLKEIAGSCAGGEWSPGNAGPNLGLSFQWALVGFLGALGLIVLRIGYDAWKQWPDCPQVSPTAPGLEPNGFSSGFKRALCALFRSASNLGRRADLLFTATALFFGVSVVILMVNALGDGQVQSVVADPAGFQAASSVPNGATRAVSFGALATLVGRWITVKFFGVIRAGHRKPATRRVIGIVWDVLGFWPRRFQPFAVRPYAERAVPELLGRVSYHVAQKGRRVLLSTHSQGTVLGFATMARIAASDREGVQTANSHPRFARNVAFLTYGSPLSQLHGRFFPAYFNTSRFNAVASGLFQGTVTLEGKQRPVSWRNFFRKTDYIGKKVLVGNPDSSGLDPSPDVDTRNHILDDPSTALMSTLPLDEPWDGYPDPMRTPWLDLAKHSYYNDEKLIKEWVAAVTAKLSL